MNYLFTHPTYGEIHYVVENGTYYYYHSDIARALGNPDGNLGGGFTDYLKDKYGDLRIKSDKKGRGARPLTSEDVKEYYCSSRRKGSRTRIASALYEWLKGQEESARNGAPCTPEPVKTEQPTKSKNCLSKFDTTFDAFTAMMSGEIEKRQQMLEACNGLREGALKYKEMYNAEKAQNATLQAQVGELKQQLADNDITDMVNNITKLRYMLGDSELKRYKKDYMYNHDDVLRCQDTYTPTQMADFVKNMSKFSMHLSAQVVNRKLEEAGYQEHCDSNEEGAYKLTSLIDESYAYKTFVKGNNDFVMPSLVWTQKGLALLIGLLLDTGLIEGTCI